MKSRLLLILLALSLLGAPIHGASILAIVRMDSMTRPGFESYILGRTMPVSSEPNTIVREMAEGMFVTYLKKSNVDAVEAFKILIDTNYTNEELKENVLNNDIKSILIIKLTGATEKETQTPGTIKETYNPYGSTYYFQPGMTITRKFLFFELTLFDAESDQMIWTATANVNCGTLTKVNHVLDSLADKTVKQLKKDGHIR